MAEYTWAKELPGCVATVGITFQQLYAESKIEVHLEQESYLVVKQLLLKRSQQYYSSPHRIPSFYWPEQVRLLEAK